MTRSKVLVGLLLIAATLLLMLPARASVGTDCEQYPDQDECQEETTTTVALPEDTTTTTVEDATTTTTVLPPPESPDTLTCEDLPPNIPIGDPAYSEELDGDGDGVACEAPIAPPAQPQPEEPRFTG